MKVTVSLLAHLFLIVTSLWVPVLAFLWFVGFMSLLWCEPSREYSPTSAGFLVECLPPWISMHFTTQAHRYTLRINVLIQFSALFNIFLLCCLFPVYYMWVSVPATANKALCWYIHLPIPPTSCRQKSKWVSCPGTIVLLKILLVMSYEWLPWTYKTHKGPITWRI